MGEGFSIAKNTTAAARWRGLSLVQLASPSQALRRVGLSLIMASA